MVQRFVLSNLIPEHTWLNPSTSYFYFTDGEHLLTNYMMNIEKKRGIDYHSWRLYANNRSSRACWMLCNTCMIIATTPLAYIYISMAYSLLHVSLFYFKNNPAWSWKSFMLKKTSNICPLLPNQDIRNLQVWKVVISCSWQFG